MLKEKLLDVNALAEYLGFERRVIYNLVKDGHIKYIKFGKKILFRPEHVEQFLKKNEKN